MRLFKRISSTVLSSVDKVVSEVENHDAVVESMLKDLHRASATTKVRQKRVTQDGVAMRAQLQKVQQDEQKWTERASTFAAVDEAKALSCLERRQRCRQEIERLQKMLLQHADTERKLIEQVRTIEQRHAEIGNKRHLMQSRQAVVEANRVVAAVTGAGSVDVNDAFDRWEMSITQAESSGGHSFDGAVDGIDDFEQQFIDSETKQKLQDELRLLTSNMAETTEQKNAQQGDENE